MNSKRQSTNSNKGRLQKRVVLSILLLLGILFSPVTTLAREGTEWFTAYWYNANDSKLPRVLLIGDSIVRGYEAKVRNGLAGEAYIAFCATSKGADDPSYLKELAYVLGEYKYDVIHFNNGLHSLSANPEKWKAGLCAALGLIQEKGNGAKIIWASSTPLKDVAATESVKRLNAIAAEVMSENHIPVNDLFKLMDPMNRSTYWVDTFHFNAAATDLQANQVVKNIRETLGSKPRSATEASAALSRTASETGPDGKIKP